MGQKAVTCDVGGSKQRWRSIRTGKWLRILFLRDYASKEQILVVRMVTVRHVFAAGLKLESVDRT